MSEKDVNGFQNNSCYEKAYLPLSCWTHTRSSMREIEQRFIFNCFVEEKTITAYCVFIKILRLYFFFMFCLI